MTNGFPVSYSAGGRQYVAFVVGPSGASWAGVLPTDLLPELQNPTGGSGVFVFALP
jgi:hypothetical protein